MTDETRWLIASLLPRCACVLLWRLKVPLGDWAPFMLGRILGSKPRKMEEGDEEEKAT